MATLGGRGGWRRSGGLVAQSWGNCAGGLAFVPAHHKAAAAGLSSAAEQLHLVQNEVVQPIVCPSLREPL